MNFFKEVYKLWNDNFNKGVTVFQMCLMASMVFFGIQNNQQGLLFSMTACLFGYFEPNQDRLSIRGWYPKDEEGVKHGT